VEQVWFPGVHSNIGGGYENTGLSDVALHWMLSRIETKKIGLQLVTDWKNAVAVDPTANPLAKLYESRTAAYAWSRFSPMIRVINQRRLRLAGPARTCGLPRHAIPLGEMVHWSALMRWRKSEESGSALPAYRPINLEAALNDTFKPAHQNPQPIPIVGEAGEPLDWIDNEDDFNKLMKFLPTQYHDACRRTVKSFAAAKRHTSAFSQSYQQPSESRSSRADQVSE
jgi:hypothetical protein